MSFFPITFLLLFVLLLPTLSSNMVLLFCQPALFTDSYRRGCFVFSGSGQCVYLSQILDLFITTVDLGSTQAHSPRHQAAMSADRPVEALLFIDSEQAVAWTVPPATATHTLYPAPCSPRDWPAALKAMKCFIMMIPIKHTGVYTGLGCTNMLKSQKMDTSIQVRIYKDSVYPYTRNYSDSHNTNTSFCSFFLVKL